MRLIDTSIWIRILKRGQARSLGEYVVGLIRRREAAVSDVVLTELLVGARDEREYADYRSSFGGMTLYNVTPETWARAARLGYHLGRRGLPTGVPDLIIAASAIEHDAVLLHADSDFDRIAQHSDLKVESYVT